MQKNCVQSLTIFSLFLLFFQACSPDNRPIPEVSDIEAPLEIVRFEQALYQMDTINFESSLEELSQKHPEFTALFTANILEAGEINHLNEEQLAYLRGFITSPVYRAVYDTTQLLYSNLDVVKEDLQHALKLFKYYFPDQSAPTKLTTFVSAFNYSAIIYGENELAASLDLFLGPNFNYQQYNPSSTIFSDYLVRSYTPDYLVSNLLNVLVEDIVGQQKGNRLLDIIIGNGKKLYILDQLLPMASDTVKFNVSEPQWQWLQENEQNLWAYLLSEDLLYNTNYQDIRKLVDPSPSGAPLLPEESPGQAANYVGYNIVKAFMTRNKELSLSDLLQYTEAQEIMDKSRYKPRKN